MILQKIFLRFAYFSRFHFRTLLAVTMPIFAIFSQKKTLMQNLFIFPAKKVGTFQAKSCNALHK